MDLLILLSIVIIAWFSACFGITDAILYSRKGSKAFESRWEKRWLVINRINLFIAGLYLASIMYYNMVTEEYPLYYFAFDTVILIFASFLNFSFWHNGFYYITREKIDPHLPYKFNSFSREDRSLVSLSYKKRRLLMILGTTLTLLWSFVG